MGIPQDWRRPARLLFPRKDSKPGALVNQPLAHSLIFMLEFLFFAAVAVAQLVESRIVIPVV
ncbi:hypothetical protein, partial [Bordetella pseudohinzii]|uniref:hypothetical protein n=1 Tax=Bordetella pseudohinzii TaxID=1331258 RepID=UPI001E42D733